MLQKMICVKDYKSRSVLCYAAFSFQRIGFLFRKQEKSEIFKGITMLLYL